MATTKGFIQDWLGNNILPITRGELVLDQEGNVALNSKYFLAGEGGAAYGLVTAAERAMLTGGGQGGGISDLYAKLELINNGFEVNGTALNFYNAEGTATPINFVPANDTISIIAVNNTVNFSLGEVSNAETIATQILKGIQVDKYGRVTSVTSADLTNADIPTELSGKTIKNGILDGCTTAIDGVGTDAKSVVNKGYVDSKIQEVTGLATSSLKFGGVISDASTANTLIKDKDALNSYYKITGVFNYPTTNFRDTAGLVLNGDGTITTKIGDTIIIYSDDYDINTAKFIYIPSADDITSITVKCDSESSNVFTNKVGFVTLQFSNPFISTGSNGNTAYITLPEVSKSSVGGYLSRADYNAFKNYSDSLKVAYDGEFSSGTNVYKIGTLTVGTTEHAIYGKNTTYGLSLNNGSTSGSNQEYNPILKFTSTDANDVNITFKGLTSIKVKKNGDVVEIGAVNEVDTNSAKYLEFDSNNKLKAKIGSLNNNTVVQGLTDYEEFATFRANVLIEGTKFLAITNSLKDTSADLFYGSTDLATAVYIETI